MFYGPCPEERGHVRDRSLEIYTQVFFANRRDILPILGRYERMFHRGTLPRRNRQLSPKFCAKIKFAEKSSTTCLIQSLSGIWHFVIYFWKLLKAYPLNCSGTDTLNASKLSWLHTGELHRFTFHMHTRSPCALTRTHNSKEPANWFRQLNIWHLSTSFIFSCLGPKTST